MKTQFATALLGTLAFAADTDRYTICGLGGCFYGCNDGEIGCQPQACLGDTMDNCTAIPMNTFFQGPDSFDWSGLQAQI